MNDLRTAEIAEWVKSLRYEDIPQRVTEKAKAQLLSVLGAIYAGSILEESRSIVRAVGGWDYGSQCTVLATGQKLSCQGALYVNSAMSMAHDFDDYLFMGHTGHSAVLVPLALCEKQDLSLQEMTLAQILANEVSGRLGASALIGPLNGQMWTFIHLLGAACSSGKLLGLDREQLKYAIGIALYQPHIPIEPGFFGTGSKLLSAAVPSVQGLQAACLSQKGLTGALDVLDHPRAFYRIFSYYPIQGMWGGLGKTWVTDTLAIKIYPGCAYIDSGIDALKKIMDRIRDEQHEPLKPENVESILVRTTVLGTEMEHLSREYEGKGLHSVLVNFSLRYSAALMILTGSLEATHCTEAYLRKHEGALRTLAGKVSVVPDLGLNVYLLRMLVDTMGTGTILADISLKDILYIVQQAARNYHIGKWARAHNGSLRGTRPTHVHMGKDFTGSISATLLKILRQRWHSRSLRYDLGNEDPEKFVFPFASRLTVRLKGGREYNAEQMIPLGAPGNKEHNLGKLAEEKFAREAARILTSDQIQKAISLVREMPPHGKVRELVPLIAKKKVKSRRRVGTT